MSMFKYVSPSTMVRFIVTLAVAGAAARSLEAQTMADTINIASVVEKTVMVAPGSRTVTITLVNPSKTKSASVELVAQFVPPRPTGRPDPNDFFSEDSAGIAQMRIDSARNDSLAKLWSMGAWFDSLPRRLTLPPDAKHVVTLRLAVPPELAAGEYSTYIVVTTALTVRGEKQSVNIGGKVSSFDPEFEIWPAESVWPRRSVRLIYRSK